MYNHTVKQGETLNGIAQSYGFSDYKNAGITSVKSGNFDLISPGEQIGFKGSMVEPNVYKVGNMYTDKSGNKLNYTPTMQTTTQENTKNTKDGQKLDAITGSMQGPTNPQNPNAQNPATNAGLANGDTSATNPDGTPRINYKAPDGITAVSETPQAGAYAYRTPATLQAGEKLGYGTDGKRYIIDKAGKTRNDAFADQEYEENKADIQRVQETKRLYESIKMNTDATHATILEGIMADSAMARRKAKEMNDRYLALQKNEGFSGGQARYMSDINNGILRDTEERGNARLFEIDMQEKVAMAKASQAKNADQFKELHTYLGDLKSLRKEKEDTIQAVYKSVVDFNKNIDNQQKELENKEKLAFEQGAKTLTTSAPALIKSYDMLKTPELKQSYIEKMSKRLRQSPEAVLGAIEDQRTQNAKEERDIRGDEVRISATDRSNRPKAKGVAGDPDDFGGETQMTPEEQARITSSQKVFGIIDNAMATNYKDEQGVPTVSAKGYLTYTAFKEFLAVAIQKGATREEFITRFQSRLNLSLGSGAQKGYGLTEAEFTKVKKYNQ